MTTNNKSIFNSGTLFGDPDLQNLIQHIDSLNFSLGRRNNLEDPSNRDLNSAFNDVLTLVSNEEKIPGTAEQTPENSIQHLIKDLSVPTQRQNRYRVYDEIYSSVQIIKRIIQVYTNNILQKDIITGKSLTVLENKENQSDSSLDAITSIHPFINSIIKKFKLEDILTNSIISNILKYGDCYLEIIDLQENVFNLPDPGNKTSDVSLNNSTILTEHNNQLNISKQLNIIHETLKIDKNNISYLEEQLGDLAFNLLIEMEDLDTDPECQYIIESDDLIKLLNDKAKSNSNKPSNIKQFKRRMLDRFIIRVHSPKKIVNLTTIHNDTNLGYVEVQEKESVERVPGVGLQFATILKQISTVNKDKKDDLSDITKKIVNRLITKIIEKSQIHKQFNQNKSIKEINKEFEKQLHTKLGDELFFLVKKLFNESGLNNGPTGVKLGVRYISPKNIIPMCLKPIEYYPYGTSIIDPLVYPAKLYLLNQLTNMVIKLSRASLVRKWTIESGPREHGTNLMQKLKREIRNQRITVDDIVNFKSIPKILSDFKDMMVLTKKGTKFVDVDVQSLGDPNLKIADLEDARKEIIALAGIPAPYLGYNDVVDLREQLVNINITFATEIISIQAIINNALTKLMDEISERLGFEDVPSDYITIMLKPPVILLLQMLEATMSSIGNIQMSLQAVQVNFDPFYLLKKFIPNIDWDDFQKQAEAYTLYKNAATPPTSEMGGV